MTLRYLLILICCLLCSSVLSGMEAGVFALSRLRIRQQMRAGKRRARVLHGYLEHPENFLWTIFMGNTLANFTAFALVVSGLHYWVGEWPLLFWPAVLGAVFLFYGLVELLPKVVFRMYPNRLCMWLAIPFGVIHFVLRPLVAPVAFLSKWLLRWSRGQRFTGHLFGTREEFRLVMQESSHGLTTEERAMINRVLDLQNKTVQSVAVPISQVVSVQVDTPVRDLLRLFRERGFSRLPVWDRVGPQRRLAGLVCVSRLIYRPSLDLEGTAGDHLQPVLKLENTMRLEVALRKMQRAGQRLAAVTGPDQTELGVVSLQDILRFLFGEVRL